MACWPYPVVEIKTSSYNIYAQVKALLAFSFQLSITKVFLCEICIRTLTLCIHGLLGALFSLRYMEDDPYLYDSLGV